MADTGGEDGANTNIEVIRATFESWSKGQLSEWLENKGAKNGGAKGALINRACRISEGKIESIFTTKMPKSTKLRKRLKQDSVPSTGVQPKQLVEMHGSSLKFRKVTTSSSPEEEHTEKMTVDSKMIIHWKCLLCNVAKLLNVSALMQHILTHLGVEPSCSNLKKHFTNWLSDVPLKCQFCDEEFCRSRDLDCHYRFHATQTSWECETCKQMFSSHSDLRKYSHKAASKIVHRASRKKEPKAGTSCVSTPRMTFNCDRCDKSFLRPRNFHMHHLLHTVVRPYKCDECDTLFIQSHKLEEHRHVHEKEHRCMFCCKSYTKKCNLKQHLVSMHSGERPYQCELCNKTFTQRGHLDNHQAVHTREKPYKCELCDSSFASKGNLKQHYARHSGSRPHKCDFCEKSFTQKCHLNSHHLVHSGEKPHKCYLCGQTFAHRSNLKKHVTVHTGKTT